MESSKQDASVCGAEGMVRRPADVSVLGADGNAVSSQLEASMENVPMIPIAEETAVSHLRLGLVSRLPASAMIPGRHGHADI